ncbi:hypothetical protein [Micropruina sp.]|uniref:hypothetical protein n=1 Tax=Micropruina sp. TaxID=2737536 RepID=UPI0039E6D152
MGRGSAAAMGAAAITVVGTLPPHLLADVPFVGAIVATGLYTVIAALVATVPGAITGWLLSALARAGASQAPVRLAGGLAAAVTATLVNLPMQFLSLPGVVIATMYGVVAAPWVAWGVRGSTLD